jgi:acyl-coenzyme A thioesterase 9
MFPSDIPTDCVRQHVAVEASVIDDQTGEEKKTNDFRFTWGTPERGFTRTVVPKTYEGMYGHFEDR